MNGRRIVVAVVGAAAFLAGATSAAADHRPVLLVRPTVVGPGAAAFVTVSGIDAAAVAVRVVGRARWRPLRRGSDGWHGTLPAPQLRGVYPLEVRNDGKVYRSRGWLLRVLDRRTLTRPSFAAPEAVAAWWSRTVPRPRSRLVAIRPWPLPAGDARDARLHKLFVIAYSPVGDLDPAHRLGIWITAFRNGYDGPWRLLEATVRPPGPPPTRGKMGPAFPVV